MQKTPSARPGATEASARAAYARVLHDFVNDAGEVDFHALRDKPGDLEDYVAYVAHKPFKDLNAPGELLAHHLNAYNALSMYTVLQRGIPKTNAGLRKVGFFLLTKVQVGGETLSLSAYEKDEIRALGEDRVHWALNCMSVSCPRLPRTPFVAASLERQLQDGAVEFFNSEKNVRVDDDKKEVWVTEILDFFPKDFVPRKAPTVLDYVNLYRKKPVPTGYKVKYIPYDWTINDSGRDRHG